MNVLKRFATHVKRHKSLLAAVTCPLQTGRAGLSIRTTEKPTDDEDTTVWPRRIFSGIQPTGVLHLGNYLGAVQKWTALQNAQEHVTYCIVDLHSITTPQDPVLLREHILQMAATMFACGIDPDRATVFVQSTVKEHSELCWMLGCQSTMARLGHLPQYKEKSRLLKEIPLGLFIYPVLQAADILLYKTTHVPVGEDQIQHIQLAQHLAKNFNTNYGTTFPICHAVIDSQPAARIRSLRDPKKKMSKSDPDVKSRINLTDTPEYIVEKIKKAVTDFTSDVTYDIDARPGVSNLVAIHSLVTGKSIEAICEEAKAINTGIYKMRVAEAVVEHLKPIRQKIQQQMAKRNELVYLLEIGAEKARQTAQQTMAEVKQKMGLGGQLTVAVTDVRLEVSLEPAKEVQAVVRVNEANKIERKKEFKLEHPLELRREVNKITLPVAIKSPTEAAEAAEEAEEMQAKEAKEINKTQSKAPKELKNTAV